MFYACLFFFFYYYFFFLLLFIFVILLLPRVGLIAVISATNLLPIVKFPDPAGQFGRQVAIASDPSKVSTLFSMRGEIPRRGFAAWDSFWHAGMAYTNYTPMSAVDGTVTPYSEELAFRELLGNIGFTVKLHFS